MRGYVTQKLQNIAGDGATPPLFHKASYIKRYKHYKASRASRLIQVEHSNKSSVIKRHQASSSIIKHHQASSSVIKHHQAF